MSEAFISGMKHREPGEAPGRGGQRSAGPADIEQRYRSFFDHMPDLLVRVDAELRYVDANRRFCEFVGSSCERLIGQRVGTVHPEMGRAWVDVFRSVISDGQEREMAFEHESPRFGRRWFETRLLPELSADGHVVSVLAVARDVTDRRLTEIALRASEARLRLITQRSPAILWTTDCELHLVSLCGGGLDNVGLKPADLVGHPLQNVIQGEEYTQAIVAHQRALQGHAVEYDDTFRQRTYRARVEPLHNESNEIIGVIGVAFDLTDLKHVQDKLRHLNAVLEARVAERTCELDRALDALRENEAMFRALLEQMPDGLYVTELDDSDPPLRIVLANEAAARMIGTPAQQLVGRSFLELCADHTSTDQIAGDLTALRRGETVRLEGSHRRADGTVFPIELTARLVQHGDHRVAMGIVRDETQRRAAEAQLRLIQSAVDQVTDAVVITDAAPLPPGPRIIYVNPAFTGMSGYEPEEVLGRVPRILQTQQDYAGLPECYARGEPLDGEVVVTRKDGTPYHLAWHMGPIRNEAGEVTNWVAVERDISSQKQQAERDRQHQSELAHVARLSTLGEMASGLAHELNQPLAAIANYARGSLRRLEGHGVTDDTILEALARIAAQAERSGQIIQRLRQFVRKRELQTALIDVNTLVREATTLVEPEAAQRQVRIQFELDPQLPPVKADSIVIEQVLINLVRNAIEAMSETPKALRVVTLRTDADGDTCHVHVADRGPGLCASELERAFDAFYTTKPRGMGMGLTISRTLIEAHQGRLWATQNADHGLTLHIMLPVNPDV